MDLVQRINENMLPFGKLLGITCISATPDEVVAEMVVRDDLCTRPEILHGGAVMSLADNLGGIATMLNLPEGAGTTTIESKTNFLAAAPAGETVRAVATPIHKGRSTMVWQTWVSNEKGRLVALVTQTQMVRKRA